MSVLRTIDLVKSFCQSDVCKITCSNVEDPYYLYSGNMNGDFISNDRCETPIRSCGCKAKRVFDRTRPISKPTNEKYCLVWNYVVSVTIHPESWIATNGERKSPNLQIWTICDAHSFHSS